MTRAREEFMQLLVDIRLYEISAKMAHLGLEIELDRWYSGW